VTGDINEAYLAAIEASRSDGDKNKKPSNSSTQLDLNLVGSECQEETAA